LNLRPPGPERLKDEIHSVVPSGTETQPLETSRVETHATSDALAQIPPRGTPFGAPVVRVVARSRSARVPSDREHGCRAPRCVHGRRVQALRQSCTLGTSDRRSAALRTGCRPEVHRADTDYSSAGRGRPRSDLSLKRLERSCRGLEARKRRSPRQRLDQSVPSFFSGAPTRSARRTRAIAFLRPGSFASSRFATTTVTGVFLPR